MATRYARSAETRRIRSTPRRSARPAAGKDRWRQSRWSHSERWRGRCRARRTSCQRRSTDQDRTDPAPEDSQRQGPACPAHPPPPDQPSHQASGAAPTEAAARALIVYRNMLPPTAPCATPNRSVQSSSRRTIQLGCGSGNVVPSSSGGNVAMPKSKASNRALSSADSLPRSSTVPIPQTFGSLHLCLCFG